MYLYMPTHTHVYIHIYIYTHIHMYTYAHIHICIFEKEHAFLLVKTIMIVQSARIAICRGNPTPLPSAGVSLKTIKLQSNHFANKCRSA